MGTGCDSPNEPSAPSSLLDHKLVVLMIKIYWSQMIAVQNLVELLDLPQDLLSHQVMEQFTHGTAKQTAEV